MSNSEENKYLLDTIKRPIRYYRISINGFGGETAYVKLSKEQYEFWLKLSQTEDISEYMYNTTDFVETHDIADQFNFLKVITDDEVFYYEWYDNPNIELHQYGANIDSSGITVDEHENGEYHSEFIDSVVDSNDIFQFMEDNDLDNITCVCPDEQCPTYVLHFSSYEKGTFFDGRIEVAGKFDPAKLKIVTTEFWNSEEIITSITYNDVEIDNDGAETRDKGCEVSLWKNE